MKPQRCPYCRGPHTSVRYERREWGGEVFWLGMDWCDDCDRMFTIWAEKRTPQLSLPLEVG